MIESVPRILVILSVLANLGMAGALFLLSNRGERVSGPCGLMGNCAWSNAEAAQEFSRLPVRPGGVVFLGDSLTAEGPWAVSYTHLTLPTSDLV